MRAQDIRMGAVAYHRKRTVFVTGAIDRNDVAITLGMNLPEDGVWTIIKAEVNLTNERWTHWVMLLGDGTRIPQREEDRFLASRNFKFGSYFLDHQAIVFSGGEVRPGESVLKTYSVELEAGNTKYILNHTGRIGQPGVASRVASPVTEHFSAEETLRATLRNRLPVETVAVPVEVRP